MNEFLIQVELDSQCSLIGLNDADFNSKCLSNANIYFLKHYCKTIMVK